ncbi:MAG: NAD(P)-dependent oxidoreductase [Pseudomonadales bacterium]
MHIAFIGLGNMGGAICQHLTRAQHQVRVFDLSTQALEAARAHGAEPCQSLAQALTQAELVFTSLPSPADVTSVALDPGGIATNARPGAIHVDLSTNAPAAVAQIGKDLAASDIEMLDAPVSGGVFGAQRGQLTIMVGGAPATFERALPVLDTFARSVTHVGPLGSGTIAKLVNNLIACNNVASAAEAFRLGTAAGMDPQILDNVIRNSSGDSVMYRAVARKFLSADWSANFALDLAAKDMALVQALAQQLDTPLPIGTQTSALLDMASSLGFGQDDIAALLRVNETP